MGTETKDIASGKVKQITGAPVEVEGDYNNRLTVGAQQSGLSIVKDTYQKRNGDTLEDERIKYTLKVGDIAVSALVSEAKEGAVSTTIKKAVDEAFLNDFLSGEEAAAFKKAVLAYNNYASGKATKEEVIARFNEVLQVADKENSAAGQPVASKPSRSR